MGIVFKNNAKTTLSSGVNNSTTTIPVTEGSVFPAADLAGSGTFFLATLDDTTNNEIVKVTTCSGNSGNINLTVVRAQEGTTARAFSSGDQIELRFTAGTIDHIRSDNTVHTNTFTTANASTTDFTLNQSVVDENDLVVFIDGVFQAHNTYTVSGTTLTLATAPASGRVVTAYSIKGLRSATNVAIATMTGDNSDTTLTLPIEPINENSVQVFFDGVYQNKSTFSISGTTLTFSTAPPTGVEVEAILLTQTNIDTAAILKDADGDTKVQVEESSDEDKIRFDTGGTERMVIDDAGKTTINGDTFINRGNQTSGVIKLGGTTDGGFLDFDGGSLQLNTQRDPNTGTFVNTGKAHASIIMQGVDADSNIRFYTTTSNNSTANQRMVIDKNGYVGIGVASPDQALVVKGVIETQTTNSTNGWMMYAYTDNTLRFNYNGAGSDELLIDSSGNITTTNHPIFMAIEPAQTAGGNNNLIIFGAENHDQGGHYNTTNGRFTAPVTGKYFFTVSILLQPNNTGNSHYARLTFRKNGSLSHTYGETLNTAFATDAGSSSTTSNYQSVSMSTIMSLAASDYVDVINSGTMSTYGTNYGSFAGFLVG